MTGLLRHRPVEVMTPRRGASLQTRTGGGRVGVDAPRGRFGNEPPHLLPGLWRVRPQPISVSHPARYCSRCTSAVASAELLNTMSRAFQSRRL